MIRFRLIVVGFGFLAIFALILFRAFQLQILPQTRVARLARRQLHQTLEIVGRRGVLADREGRELAVSVNSLSIFANPTLIDRPARAAHVLARVLGGSESLIRQRLDDSSERHFIWIARQLSEAQMKRLQAVDLKTLPGIGVLPEYRREYPHGTLAAHLLGFVSVDGKGLEGIERKFDAVLKGERNVVTIQKDALGRPLFSESHQLQLNMTHGSEIELTIDANLQHSAERALHETVEHHQAEGGTIIVMDPYRGDILALANEPTFDPNAVIQYPMAARRNRALTDPIEPGSVVKPFVVARALEDHLVTPQTMVPAGNGQVRVGHKLIGEAEAKHRFAWLSVVDLIRISSNVATVMLAQRMGYPRVEDTFSRVGFGAVTGLDIGPESRGLFRKLDKSQLLEQATVSFGQGIATTPMQMATAYSVIANGGFKVKPRIIRRIVEAPNENGDGRGAKTENFSEDPERNVRIFSERTSRQMKSILERVVEGEGTGVLARVEGFQVAGKTGTAQRADFGHGGYETGAYVSSFAGFIPSQNPRYVIYVAIDRPHANGHFGGTVAAPAFAQVARAAIRFGSASAAGPVVTQAGTSGLRKIATGPSATESSFLAAPRAAVPAGRVPDVVNLPLRQAFRALQDKGYRLELMGEGEGVAAQMPGPGERSPDQVIYLKLR